MRRTPPTRNSSSTPCKKPLHTGCGIGTGLPGIAACGSDGRPTTTPYCASVDRDEIVQGSIGQNSAQRDQVEGPQRAPVLPTPGPDQLDQQDSLSQEGRQAMDVWGEHAAFTGQGDYGREQVTDQRRDLDAHVGCCDFPLYSQHDGRTESGHDQQQKHGEQRPPGFPAQERRGDLCRDCHNAGPTGNDTQEPPETLIRWQISSAARQHYSHGLQYTRLTAASLG